MGGHCVNVAAKWQVMTTCTAKGTAPSASFRTDRHALTSARRRAPAKLTSSGICLSSHLAACCSEDSVGCFG
eukprot:364416-Chlamydomonas_euryale.AAC.17